MEDCHENGGDAEGRGVDETDIAPVESSSILLRCTLKNPSKVRHAELRNQLWIERRRGRKKKKEKVKSRRKRPRENDTREGGCREFDLTEKSLEGFGSADAYNRSSLSSNKTRTSISPSEKYRFRATRDIYFRHGVSGARVSKILTTNQRVTLF